MPHPSDDSLIPIGTEVIWTRPSFRVHPKVVKAKIVNHKFLMDGKNFLNYEVEMEREPGKIYPAYHDDLKIVN